MGEPVAGNAATGTCDRIESHIEPERWRRSSWLVNLPSRWGTGYGGGGKEGVTSATPGSTYRRDAMSTDGIRARSEQLADLANHVTNAAPDIVFVGLGSPKQERLIQHLRASLPTVWWLGVGISFSFLCNKVKRAPRWVQWAGFEWAHRLAREPRRLARRYLREGIPFTAQLLTAAAWQGLRAGGERQPVRD